MNLDSIVKEEIVPAWVIDKMNKDKVKKKSFETPIYEKEPVDYWVSFEL